MVEIFVVNVESAYLMSNVYNNLIIKRRNFIYIIFVDKNSKNEYNHYLIDFLSGQKLFEAGMSSLDITYSINDGLYSPIKYKNGRTFCNNCGINLHE